MRLKKMQLIQTSLLFSFLLLVSRSHEQNSLVVNIGSKTDFCLVVPKDYQTTIGDSEYEGGETVWCDARGTQTPGATGTFQGDFWKQVEISSPKDGVIQMTGCINVSTCDRLVPSDGGGQYDSNGGDGGRGNPAGSYCANYHSYVQLIEPSANRACLRCCANPNDCDLSQDTSGCPTVVPGNYFDCS